MTVKSSRTDLTWKYLKSKILKILSTILFLFYTILVFLNGVYQKIIFYWKLWLEFQGFGNYLIGKVKKLKIFNRFCCLSVLTVLNCISSPHKLFNLGFFIMYLNLKN
jgi:hypothetical protein